MSIYAGIPTGAYNSEAAMLYGGLAPDDFNTDAMYNFLMPWFTRNDISPETAPEIAQAVSEYLKVATAFRLRRDGAGLAEFWRRFMVMSPTQRDILRRAVNYVRHKKRIPLTTMSKRLAEAENWGEALPYLRAVPGIGKKVPRPLLHWLSMSPLGRQLQRSRWEYLIPDVDAMDEKVPERVDFVEPTLHQRDMLARRRAMAARMAQQREELRREFPPVERPKKQYPPDVEEYRQRLRNLQRSRLLRALQTLNTDAKLEDQF